MMAASIDERQFSNQRLYRRAPGVYRPLRNTVLGTWLIAIPIYATVPVAPPRLAHAGIVDAVSEQAGFALTAFHPLLQPARRGAQPARRLCLRDRDRRCSDPARAAAKALAILSGPLVSLAVVVTGNHDVFDIAAGLIVTAIGYPITRPIPRVDRAYTAPRSTGRR